MKTWFSYSSVSVHDRRSRIFFKVTIIKVSALIRSIFSCNVHKNIYVEPWPFGMLCAVFVYQTAVEGGFFSGLQSLIHRPAARISGHGNLLEVGTPRLPAAETPWGGTQQAVLGLTFLMILMHTKLGEPVLYVSSNRKLEN